MNDYMERLIDYRLKGYCCSQILLQLGLDENESQNPELINAMKGLCGGLNTGLLCGALSGGACLLSYFNPEKASSELIPQLVEWFKDSFDSYDCKEIIGDEPINRIEKCPDIVARTYEKVKELLEECE